MARSKAVKFETRVCPGCGAEKNFPKRNETCSNECRWKMENSPVAQELRSLRKQLAEALVRTARDERYESFIARVESSPTVPPAWISPAKVSTKNRLVIPTAFLSDPHFDEVIFPAQVNGVNAYNREIGAQRLEQFFKSAVKVGKEFLKGLSFPGICVPLGGDMFSGNIHEELKETNEGSLCEAILHWLAPMEAGLTLLAEEYGKVYLPCVVGNHTRLTRKPINKGRVRDNIDWLFYQLLAKSFAGDPRLQFDISESPDLNYQLYRTRYCLTHGDQFNGGSGISGVFAPLMIGDARKRKKSTATNQSYDYLVMGHWHQLMSARGVIINGSLKGYDEYAFNKNFDYEPPQQAFWLTSAERKEIWAFSPLHVTKSGSEYSGTSTVIQQPSQPFSAAMG